MATPLLFGYVRIAMEQSHERNFDYVNLHMMNLKFSLYNVTRLNATLEIICGPTNVWWVVIN